MLLLLDVFWTFLKHLLLICAAWVALLFNSSCKLARAHAAMPLSSTIYCRNGIIEARFFVRNIARWKDKRAASSCPSSAVATANWTVRYCAPFGNLRGKERKHACVTRPKSTRKRSTRVIADEQAEKEEEEEGGQSARLHFHSAVIIRRGKNRFLDCQPQKVRRTARAHSRSVTFVKWHAQKPADK